MQLIFLPPSLSLPLSLSLHLQYSLLQTVVEACQKKKHCKFHGSPQFYGLGASGVGDSSGTSSYHSSTASSNAISSDPCPKRRKIVEVAYKCRPCKSAPGTNTAKVLFNLSEFIGRTMGHVNWLTNSAYVYVILRIRTTIAVVGSRKLQS